MSRCCSNNLSSLFFNAVLFLLHFYLQSIRRKDDPQEVKVQMQFVVYGTRPSKDKSGAYLFLPDGKAKVFLSERFICLPEGFDSVLCVLCVCLMFGCSGRGGGAGRLGAALSFLCF